MQVPDAVYYMMRNTPLVACNISSNVITKIPPKLTLKFSFIKSEWWSCLSILWGADSNDVPQSVSILNPKNPV